MRAATFESKLTHDGSLTSLLTFRLIPLRRRTYSRLDLRNQAPIQFRYQSPKVLDDLPPPLRIPDRVLRPNKPLRGYGQENGPFKSHPPDTKNPPHAVTPGTDIQPHLGSHVPP